jgi:hypothetical protein
MTKSVKNLFESEFKQMKLKKPVPTLTWKDKDGKDVEVPFAYYTWTDKMYKIKRWTPDYVAYPFQRPITLKQHELGVEHSWAWVEWTADVVDAPF